MTKMVAGAFDDFASAQAAAEDLQGSGLGDGNVTMGVSDDPEVARAILTRHHAVLLGDTQPGVSII